MLRTLRQCRALLVTLLLAAPGSGGTWLAVAHPCPVDTPWLAQSGHGHHETPAGSGEEHAPADQSSCHCVGTCHSGAATLAARTPSPAARLAIAGWSTAPSNSEVPPPAQPRLRRHPPATAPPLS